MAAINWKIFGRNCSCLYRVTIPAFEWKDKEQLEEPMSRLRSEPNTPGIQMYMTFSVQYMIIKNNNVCKIPKTGFGKRLYPKLKEPANLFLLVKTTPVCVYSSDINVSLKVCDNG
jgi:hypothetical protein